MWLFTPLACWDQLRVPAPAVLYPFFLSLVRHGSSTVAESSSRLHRPLFKANFPVTSIRSCPSSSRTFQTEGLGSSQHTHFYGSRCHLSSGLPQCTQTHALWTFWKFQTWLAHATLVFDQSVEGSPRITLCGFQEGPLGSFGPRLWLNRRRGCNTLDAGLLCLWFDLLQRQIFLVWRKIWCRLWCTSSACGQLRFKALACL